MTPAARLLPLWVLTVLPACQTLDRFDTEGSAAYCGSIVNGRFVRTTESEGGFARIRMKLRIDADQLTTAPGTLTTDDSGDAPCAPRPTFDAAPMRVTPELVGDPLAAMVFDDGQIHNVIGWVDSTCRGSMLAIVSLYKNDRVDVRLLKPRDPNASAERDAFAHFALERSDTGCGF